MRRKSSSLAPLAVRNSLISTPAREQAVRKPGRGRMVNLATRSNLACDQDAVCKLQKIHESLQEIARKKMDSRSSASHEIPAGQSSGDGLTPVRKRRHRWVWFVVLIAFGLLFYWVIQHQQKSQTAAMAGGRRGGFGSIPVSTVTARKGSIGVYFDAIGTVTPDLHRLDHRAGHGRDHGRSTIAKARWCTKAIRSSISIPGPYEAQAAAGAGPARARPEPARRGADGSEALPGSPGQRMPFRARPLKTRKRSCCRIREP